MSEQQPEPKPEQIMIEIDWSDEPPPAYANGAQILSSAREFAIVFTDFVAFAGRGNVAADKPPKAKMVANLRVTPDVFFQLAAACASNWNNFVNKQGDPARQPRFKLFGIDGIQLDGVGPDPAAPATDPAASE